MIHVISQRITAVGVADREVQLFENQYAVPDGIMYNSYLLEADRPVVVDSVDSAFALEWLDNIHEALGGREPQAMVCLHLEPDHSGSMVTLLDRYPKMKLVISAKAASMLPHFVHEAIDPERIVAVREGDTFEIEPGRVLRFFMAPMVHWPEVMVAWYEAEKTIFSADAFGTFGISPRTVEEADDEAARYYFNIVGKYGAPVQTLLRKASSLPIERACALHGPVLTGEALAHAVGNYDRWSRYEADIPDGVLIAVASVYGHTMEAALRLADRLGSRARLIDLCHTEVSYAVGAAFRCATTVLAASSYDGGVFPAMENFLTRLRNKTWRNRRVALIENGSWAPCAARTMKSLLEPVAGLEYVGPTVTITTSLDDASRAAIDTLAESL